MAFPSFNLASVNVFILMIMADIRIASAVRSAAPGATTPYRLGFSPANARYSVNWTLLRTRERWRWTGSSWARHSSKGRHVSVNLFLTLSVSLFFFGIGVGETLPQGIRSRPQ